MDEQLLDLLKERRSIRRFKAEKIESQYTEILKKGALLSPSSMNRCPWEFIFIDDTEKILKISKAKEHGSNFVSSAPLVVVVAADTKKSDVWVEDCSIASTLIQLLAQSCGLGSCWIQIRNRYTADGIPSSEYLKTLCSLSDNFEVESVIALGYPDEKKEPHSEEDLLYEKIHLNAYRGDV